MKCILSMIMHPCALARGLVRKVDDSCPWHKEVQVHRVVAAPFSLLFPLLHLYIHIFLQVLCMIVHLPVALSVHKTGGTLSLALGGFRMSAAPDCCITK